MVRKAEKERALDWPSKHSIDDTEDPPEGMYGEIDNSEGMQRHSSILSVYLVRLIQFMCSIIIFKVPHLQKYPETYFAEININLLDLWSIGA